MYVRILLAGLRSLFQARGLQAQLKTSQLQDLDHRVQPKVSPDHQVHVTMMLRATLGQRDLLEHQTMRTRHQRRVGQMMTNLVCS